MPAQTTAYTSSSFPSPAPSRPPLSHPQRCEYTSKRCENVRALKPNGERHRLCDYHRRLANNNQRRWQNRKKMLQQQNEQSVGGMGQPILLTSEQVGHIYHQHELPPRYSTVSLPAPALAPPPQAREEPLVLPPLRQHHVLSHALSLPVSPHLGIATGADEGLEFGGVPRGMAVSVPVPQLRESYNSFEREHGASDPAHFDGGQDRQVQERKGRGEAEQQSGQAQASGEQEAEKETDEETSSGDDEKEGEGDGDEAMESSDDEEDEEVDNVKEKKEDDEENTVMEEEARLMEVLTGGKLQKTKDEEIDVPERQKAADSFKSDPFAAEEFAKKNFDDFKLSRPLARAAS